MNPEMILEISSDFWKRVLKSFSEILFSSFAKYTIERTSPHEPFAINKHLPLIPLPFAMQ